MDRTDGEVLGADYLSCETFQRDSDIILGAVTNDCRPRGPEVPVLVPEARGMQSQ